MVGGSSRIPRIREELSDQFGESKLKFDINPDEAVALGAAIYASSMQVNYARFILFHYIIAIFRVITLY